MALGLIPKLMDHVCQLHGILREAIIIDVPHTLRICNELEATVGSYGGQGYATYSVWVLRSCMQLVSESWVELMKKLFPTTGHSRPFGSGDVGPMYVCKVCTDT